MRLLLVLFLAAPAAMAWEPPTRTETGIGLAAATMLATDVAQTYFALQSPTRRELPPMSWILGDRPDGKRLIFGAGMTLIFLGTTWYALPPPYRNVLAGGTLVIEFGAVTHNAAWGLGFNTPW